MSRGHSLVVAFWVWIAAAILAPCATFAYDGQDQTGLDYDSVRESAFGYDAGSALATDERKNGMVGSRVLFDKPAEFLAAKTTPELLLDSNVVIGQGRQFLASGQNVVKASISDVEIANLVRHGRISMPGAANQIPSVANSLNVDLRINVRGQLTPKLRGNFADGVIGATSIERGSTLITHDQALINAGNAASGIRVFVRDGNIQTAFPIP